MITTTNSESGIEANVTFERLRSAGANPVTIDPQLFINNGAGPLDGLQVMNANVRMHYVVNTADAKTISGITLVRPGFSTKEDLVIAQFTWLYSRLVFLQQAESTRPTADRKR
jgi:hypothetical protein